MVLGALAINLHENDARVKSGGTMDVAFDMAPFVLEVERGTCGLGRWCWICVGNNNGTSTIIISAYIPVINKRGKGSAYRQQRRYFHQQGQKDQRCPRHICRQELTDFICVRQAKKKSNSSGG